jgi:hypothetical protein
MRFDTLPDGRVDDAARLDAALCGTYSSAAPGLDSAHHISDDLHPMGVP